MVNIRGPYTGNKSLRLSQASHVKYAEYDNLPTYLPNKIMLIFLHLVATYHQMTRSKISVLYHMKMSFYEIRGNNCCEFHNLGNFVE